MYNMSKHIKKRHNVSLLMYHIVCPAKYRKIVFDDRIDEPLKTICFEIELRYEIVFLEIGTDKDHVHFLVQSIPMNEPKKIVQIIKSITAIEVFRIHPEIKKKLRWWEFRSNGYYVNTVSAYNSEDEVMKYIQGQWKQDEYRLLHKCKYKQAGLF